MHLNQDHKAICTCLWYSLHIILWTILHSIFFVFHKNVECPNDNDYFFYHCYSGWYTFQQFSVAELAKCRTTLRCRMKLTPDRIWLGTHSYTLTWHTFQHYLHKYGIQLGAAKLDPPAFSSKKWLPEKRKSPHLEHKSWGSNRVAPGWIPNLFR